MEFLNHILSRLGKPIGKLSLASYNITLKTNNNLGKHIKINKLVKIRTHLEESGVYQLVIVLSIISKGLLGISTFPIFIILKDLSIIKLILNMQTILIKTTIILVQILIFYFYIEKIED